MKEKIIQLRKVNFISMIFTPLLFLACMLPYAAWTNENIKENFSCFTLIFLAVGVLVGSVIHEIIHAACFALFNKNGFRTIRFGAYWKHMALYCHCNEAIKVKYYRITLIMPSLILGFIPLALAYMIQSFALLFFACMMISGGIGDYFCIWLLRGFDKNSMVLDHPDKVGFLYEEI